MKKIFYYLALSLFVISCNNESNDIPAEDALSAENLKLIQEAQFKDSIIEEYFKAINEIEDNLDLIKQSEKIVNLSLNDEVGKNRKDQIIEDIRFINDLMLKYNEQVSALEKKMKNSALKSKEMERMIHRMEIQLEEKNHELMYMRAELLKLNNSFENLFSEYNERLDELDKQTGRANAAYYALGTSKELKDNKIIVKEGGVVGIGKTTSILDDFNKSYFTKIDITEVKSIELFGKGAKLVSNHPKKTYTIEKEGDNEVLIITNPEEFWSVSKYLVVILQ